MKKYKFYLILLTAVLIGASACSKDEINVIGDYSSSSLPLSSCTGILANQTITNTGEGMNFDS